MFQLFSVSTNDVNGGEAVFHSDNLSLGDWHTDAAHLAAGATAAFVVQIIPGQKWWTRNATEALFSGSSELPD